MRDPKDFPRLVLALARDFPMEERVTFGLGAFGSVGADDKPLQMPLFQMGLRLKKDWKAK